MWTPHAAGGDWPNDFGTMEADFSAGPPLTPMSNLPLHPPFGDMGTPPAAGSGETTQYVQNCQMMSQHIQTLNSKIQKFERFRGQINKDITDMLKECSEMKQKSVKNAEEKRSTTPKASQPAEAKAVSMGLPATPKMEVLKRATTEPARPLAAVEAPFSKMPPSHPPGLGLLERSVTTSSNLGGESPQLTITEEVRDGKTVRVVKWRIDRVETKFRESISRDLVSKGFPVTDDDTKITVPDIRLLIGPNLGTDISGLTMKEQKSRYEERLNKGTFNVAVKLKCVTMSGEGLIVKFRLFVGGNMSDTLEHDFADRTTTKSFDFAVDWQNDVENGTLLIGAEILGFSEGSSDSAAAPVPEPQ